MPAYPCSTCATAGSVNESASSPIPSSSPALKLSHVASALAPMDTTQNEAQETSSHISPPSTSKQNTPASKHIALWRDGISKDYAGTGAMDMKVNLTAFDRTMKEER